VLVLGAVLPRSDRLPDDVVELGREEAPHTWRLVDEVSQRLGLRPPTVLGVDPHLNAWVSRTGWRHRATLVLGAPLWTLLDTQEKVALLGHELGHVRHGDTVGSVPVAAAFSVLSRVRGLLHAEDIWWDGGSLGLFTPAINVLKWLLRLPVNGALILLWLCTARYSQRREYRADVAAARLSGPEAAGRLMMRLLGMEGTCVRVASAVRRGEGPWRALEEAAHVPERELERLVRVGAREGHQVDSMHPPTHLRLDLVRSVPPSAEPYLVSTDLEQGVERELAALQPRLLRRVEDALSYA
jgi:Zn-dependent protease with chaperone function